MMINNRDMDSERFVPEERRLPSNLLLALAQNMHAMQDFARLSPEGREKLIARAESVASKEQLRAMIGDLSEFL